MYVLLQLYPPEASSDDDDPPLDVIAVNPSEAELKGYLAAYEYRYRAACKDFDDWDDMTKDWGEEHNRMHHELRHEYQVHGSLIKGTTFKIVKCLSDDSGAYWDPDEPAPEDFWPVAHA